jgi:hypothetical protein
MCSGLIGKCLKQSCLANAADAMHVHDDGCVIGQQVEQRVDFRLPTNKIFRGPLGKEVLETIGHEGSLE